MSDADTGDALGDRAYRRGFRDKGNKREDGLADLKARSFALTAVLVLVGGFIVKFVIMAAGQA